MKKNLLSIENAINNASLKEAGKEVSASKEVSKVTQKDNCKHILLKKFPKEWHDLLVADHVGNVSEYIYNAVREKMKRDNLI
jgi:hypothetical protein